MYKEYTVFLLLLGFIMIPTGAFAWNDDDDKKAHSEQKKNNAEVNMQNYDTKIISVSLLEEIILSDAKVDTNLRYEPHSKWIDDN